MSKADLYGRPAVFLDRDGTINEEKNYLHRIDDFQFIAGAPQAIKQLNQAGYPVLVVTNQSGVARGYFSLADVETLHRFLMERLAEIGAHIDGFYICPHHPTAGEGSKRQRCTCRKGEPGLLIKAAREHGIDLSRSYMIGDKPADVEAGEKAGCTPLLVLTGYGREAAQQLPVQRVLRFADLKEAVDHICSRASFKSHPNQSN